MIVPNGPCSLPPEHLPSQLLPGEALTDVDMDPRNSQVAGVGTPVMLCGGRGSTQGRGQGGKRSKGRRASTGLSSSSKRCLEQYARGKYAGPSQVAMRVPSQVCLIISSIHSYHGPYMFV